MQRRILLAFILSFFTLTLWSALFPKPKTNPQITQVIENEEFISNKTISAPSDLSSDKSAGPAQGVFPPPVVSLNEKIITLETNKLKVDLTNIGGNLKNVTIKEYQFSMPVTNIINLSGFEDKEFILDKLENNSVVYRFEDKSGKIIKQFDIVENEYIIRSQLIVQNKLGNNEDLKVDALTLNMSSLDNKSSASHSQDNSLFEYAVFTKKDHFRKGNAVSFSEKERKVNLGAVRLISFRDRYFAAIVKPAFDIESYSIDPKKEKTLKITLHLPKGVSNQDVRALQSTIYIGPQNIDSLKKYDLGLEEAVSFSGFGLIDGIAKFIYMILHWIYKIIPNWGVAIILISAIVYFAMYPLTLKGMSSMKRMQALQPKMASLREQYKNNPQKLNKEVMELYKTNKINPMSGCLPFIFQMPVFIGLYQVLWRSVSFKGAGFLWIKDLSEPDRLFILPFSIPFMGNEINILPVVMAVIMFFQQKMTSKNMVITDEMQATQQKMMGVFLPIFLGFIFYKFASGIALYFTMFYAFSFFTQWHVYSQKVTVVNG